MCGYCCASTNPRVEARVPTCRSSDSALRILTGQGVPCVGCSVSRYPSPYLFTTERRTLMSAGGFKAAGCDRGGGKALLPDPPAHAAARLRLRPPTASTTYPRHPGMAHPAHNTPSSPRLLAAERLGCRLISGKRPCAGSSPLLLFLVALILPGTIAGQQSLPTDPPPNPQEVISDQRLENVDQRLLMAAEQLKQAADIGDQSRTDQAIGFGEQTIQDVRDAFDDVPEDRRMPYERGASRCRAGPEKRRRACCRRGDAGVAGAGPRARRNRRLMMQAQSARPSTRCSLAGPALGRRRA